MSLRVLVRRNALDPVRSRAIWPLIGVAAFVFGLIGYLSGSGFDVARLSALIMGGLAPLAALAYTYESIAGPRQSGALRVLLSYPYSRREVVLGTLFGRIIVLAAGVTAGVLVGAVSTLLFGGAFDVVGFGKLLALSLLISTVVVGIGVGVSASVARTNWAAVTAFGLYLLFFAFWGQIPTAVRYVLGGFSIPSGEVPTWVEVWNQLNPFTAYSTASATVFEETSAGAVYETLWFALAVLAAWFVLSVAVGLYRFERADL